MSLTHSATSTSLHEIADSIYRISTPIPPSVIPGGFTFNQYLLVDDEPLLFHTGPRKLFQTTREAIEKVLPISKLRHIAFSHVEADECGALNDLLAVAPQASPLCGFIAGVTSINDLADRPARLLRDGEVFSTGKHMFQWFDTPHLPHGWDCGFLMETTTRTLLCGDLFTQGGADLPALTESDILGPSEGYRAAMDYFAHTRDARTMLERLAAAIPTTLACMHGSAWRGNGAGLLLALADALEK
ncbi:MBL fold metallo-hydrolase [bacterium]|nr:MBL fold metallo-hydrolase [bacterium]